MMKYVKLFLCCLLDHNMETVAEPGWERQLGPF